MTPTLFRIELTRSTSAVDPFAFQWNGPQRYTLRHEDGPGEATFGWEPEVFAALAELADPSPSQERLARLGHKLREFLLSAFSRVAKNWSDFEQRLLEAEAAQKRVYLIFRFGAAELFALPWEQLVLGNGRLLGSVRGCIPQYEWLGASKTHPPAAPARLLFAWSRAGGSVPSDRHRVELVRSGFPFDELPDVTLDKLKAKLDEAARQGAPVGALHLLCHGMIGAEDVPGLIWNAVSITEPSAFITARDLVRVLGPHSARLRLVALCACHGGAAGPPGSALGGVAQAIHRLPVTAVIASRLPLTVEGSITLTEKLYAGLSRGAVLHEAFQQAREALSASTADELALQLYAREADGMELRPFQQAAPPLRSAPLRVERVVFPRSPEPPAPGPGGLPVLYELNAVIDSEPVLVALGAPSGPPPQLAVLRPLSGVEEGAPAGKADWKEAIAQAERFARTVCERELASGERAAVHLFGRAPLPLMFHLASRLGRRPLRVYQEPRGGGPWSLAYDSLKPTDRKEPFFRCFWPDESSWQAARGRVVITVEVARVIPEKDLADVVPEGVARPAVVRLVAAAEPSHTAVRGPDDVGRISHEFLGCLDRVREELPGVREVRLLLACPASVAAALGQAFNPKAHPPVVLYNFRTSEGYVRVHRMTA